MSVLVVEDKVALALLLHKRLKVESHEINCAAGKDTATEYAQHHCMNVAEWTYGL